MVIGAFVQDGAEFIFVNYRRFSQSCKDFSPENEKKKQNKTKQNEKKMLNIWIENFKVLFLRNSRELGFLCDCIIGVCSLNVLKNLFIMLLS